MQLVNMHEAKTNLSRLVEALVSGSEDGIIIARNGKPAVRMTAVQAAPPKRRLGLLRDRVEFDDASFQALDAQVWQGVEDEFGLTPRKDDR